MGTLFAAVLSFAVHTLFPLLTAFGIVRSLTAAANKYSGLFWIIAGFVSWLVIQLTVRFWNMPVWMPKTHNVFYGENALRYSYILFLLYAALSLVCYLVF